METKEHKGFETVDMDKEPLWLHPVIWLLGIIAVFGLLLLFYYFKAKEMERPNRECYFQSFDQEYRIKDYIEALEKYVDYVEKMNLYLGDKLIAEIHRGSGGVDTNIKT